MSLQAEFLLLYKKKFLNSRIVETLHILRKHVNSINNSMISFLCIFCLTFNK